MNDQTETTPKPDILTEEQTTLMRTANGYVICLLAVGGSPLSVSNAYVCETKERLVELVAKWADGPIRPSDPTVPAQEK